MTVTTLGRNLATRQRQSPLVIAGVDMGNYSTLISNETGTPLQFPSYIGTGNLSDFLASQGGTGGSAALRAGECAIDDGGATYYVGDLALHQSSDASTARGDAGRYTSGHTLRLLKTAVGQFCQGDVRLRLVTGAPIAMLKEQPDLKARIARALLGEHHFTFHSAAGTRQVLLTVEKVFVAMEGLAALAIHGPTQPAPVGVIDIGGGSTDIAKRAIDGRVVDGSTASLPVDMGRVGELLSQQFRALHGRALSSAEIDATLLAYLDGRESMIYHRGAKAITVAQVRLVVEQVQAQINSFVAQHWAVGQDGSVGADLAYVVTIGGGARFMTPHVDTDIRTPLAPETANVDAYAALAQRLEETGRWPTWEA